MRRILMIAFHFPPFSGSSGVQRTLRFAQYLPNHGWQPIVLTATKRAYEQTSNDLLRDIPPGLLVQRALALNTARDLAIRGRYPAFLARPDRWKTWAFAAIPVALRLVRQYRPEILWSTYPIPTAHVIAYWTARLTGLPWIADFRDPMAQDGYPADPATWRSYERIERKAISSASACVFTTRGAADAYRQRYPAFADRIALIENGFDEQSYEGLPRRGAALAAGRWTLLHSGVVYPSERDPTHLYAALAALKRTGRADGLLVRFRASGHDELLKNLARRYDVENMVDLAPPIPYRDALLEMASADALLVMQASNCNEQIPAKVYEYLRAQRPIVALTDPLGDTADLLRRCGIGFTARLDDASEIEQIVLRVMENSDSATASASAVASCSREARTRELAAMLTRISSMPAHAVQTG
jgi:glycosyltransferase involved in cell wall biosynthesis